MLEKSQWKRNYQTSHDITRQHMTRHHMTRQDNAMTRQHMTIITPCGNEEEMRMVHNISTYYIKNEVTHTCNLMDISFIYV